MLLLLLAQLSRPLDPTPDLRREQARLLASRPDVKAPIQAFAVPVGGVVAGLIVAGVVLFAGMQSTSPGAWFASLRPAVPYWLAWLGTCAVAAIPGTIWMSVRLRDYFVLTRAAGEIEDALDAAVIDAETTDP